MAKKKIKFPKTKSEAGLLVIHTIQEIFRQIDKYGPEVIKLIAKVLKFLGKWGAAGILSLRTYLDKEEKRLSAANKKKSPKAKRPGHKKAKPAKQQGGKV
jgi:hypothetical protein